jgi:predicted CopG family antitoxin
MAKQTSFSRRQRRENYRRAGFLKIKNGYNPMSEIMRNWYARTAEEGRVLHEAQTKMVQEQIEEALQIRLNKSKETWTEMGYNEAEVAMLEEAFALRAIKTRETLTVDRKKAKQLEKEAFKLKTARS